MLRSCSHLFGQRKGVCFEDMNCHRAECAFDHPRLQKDLLDWIAKQQQRVEVALLVHESGAEQKALGPSNADKLEERRLQCQEFIAATKALAVKAAQSLKRAVLDPVKSDFKRELRRDKGALPIYAHRSEIVDAVRAFEVVAIRGETGSGKSTQIVQYLADAGLAENGNVCVCVCSVLMSGVQAKSFALSRGKWQPELFQIKSRKSLAALRTERSALSLRPFITGCATDPLRRWGQARAVR